MITREQALTAQVFHKESTEPAKIERWRRNGATKTWKTRPDEFRVPVKWGMRSYDYITHLDTHVVHTEEDCPLNQN